MTPPAERKRKGRLTPGTYAYREAHGVGTPGVLRRMRQRQYTRRIADARDAALLVELQKRIGAFNASTRNA